MSEVRMSHKKMSKKLLKNFFHDVVLCRKWCHLHYLEASETFTINWTLTDEPAGSCLQSLCYIALYVLENILCLRGT